MLACVAVRIVSARSKFSQRSHDPKKGVGTRRLFNFLFLAAYAARDCFAAKSHSTTTQYHQLRRRAQCRKENNGVQRSSLKSTASWAFTLEALGSQKIWEEMHIIYLWERLDDRARARTSSAGTRNGERVCPIWNYPESSLWTGSLKVPWLQRSVFKIPGIK